LIHRYVRLALGYWRDRSRRSAWLLSIGFFICLIANTLVALAVNRWSKSFFDALQVRDPDVIIQCIIQLAFLGAVTAIAAIATLQCRMRLQVGWRLWLTSSLVERWLQKGPSRERAISHSIDNPEARIAEDGRLSVDLFVDLAGGIINIFLVSTSFIFVLWEVGGAFHVFGVVVPGFLVLAVVLYTSMTSLGMWILGRPLVASVEEKAAAEGNFRYALTKVRDELEKSNAATSGRPVDFRSRIERLAQSWALVIHGQTRIVFLTSANNLLAPAVPLVLGAPKYLAGDMSLGDLMQAAAAFLQVQLSLNWLADNALSIANWSASARRVAVLDLAMESRESGAADNVILPFPKGDAAVSGHMT
jgi:vitamin B12/bleomycin/antimicrobial peptide transport system ATP-binding/permease protein